MLLLITLAPRCFIHPRRTKQYSGAICRANRRGGRVGLRRTPGERISAKADQGFESLPLRFLILRKNQVNTIAPADYTKDSELSSQVELIIDNIIQQYKFSKQFIK